MKSRFQTYNDGILYICKNISCKSDFGAVKNAKDVYDLSECLKLAFSEMSKRDEDLSFAESRGRSLSMKVKTRFVPYLNNHSKAIIENTLYSIIKIDFDRAKSESFIYLEEERKLR